MPPGRVFVGISGYDYAGWRGRFYPREHPRRKWLEYASSLFNSIELNGTFYSLKSPDVFRRWAEQTPSRGFVFAIKGSRFITHNLKLRRAEGALANFYASGILALGRRTGPFLWQLPDSYAFDGQRKTFTNGVELSRFMADAKETHACYVQNMMSYMHGRQPTDQDKVMVDYYARLSRAGMLNLHDLELTIVTSDAFLNRLP